MKWLGFGFITRGTHMHRQCEVISYFCRVRLRLSAQLLILFWASRWFMPSVAMPSMDKTRSPTAIPLLAAFPPSVSCKNHKQLKLSPATSQSALLNKRVCQGEVHIHSVFITRFMDPFHYISIWAKLMKDLVLHHMMEGLLYIHLCVCK